MAVRLAEGIEEIESIEEGEFGARQTPTMMGPGQMANMGMTRPEELVTAESFDRAFIDSMIPHHASAIESASVAYKESGNPEIREVGQMNQWRQEWYPQS